ncbi:hypothetical protein LTR56_017520 [Elasticomyces elasticus]|nr:hypothetical protein LTR56_017520 [Elasticomyces elasticus]KAK4931546.1 hypothetical protein LTR49_001934 [Elasticomyces elasticus]KAK5766706.1 hypothetical protein LTS12_003055 [Elasticomyces elasticus]
MEHAKQDDENYLVELATKVLNTLFRHGDVHSSLVEEHLSPRMVFTCSNWGMIYSIRNDCVTADVSDCKRKATVWVLVNLGGMAFREENDRHAVREWVLRMTWRRRNVDGAEGSIGSRWICERVVPMSAAGGFIGNL